MEFKPLSPKSSSTSTTGKAPPIAESLDDVGLSEANAKGEAYKSRKTIKNVKGAGTKPKDRTIAFYPNHDFITIDKNVTIVMKPGTKVDITNFKDFIEATEDPDISKNIVDILPPLYSLHYKLISNIDTRIMTGDSVTLNFKFRAIDATKALQQSIPVKVKTVMFVKLNDMTSIIAYLENGEYYPINQLDLYNEDRPD